MQSPVPPIEYEIFEYKIKKNLRYNYRPVWQRKRAPQPHELKGRIGENHDWQIHTDMVENEPHDTSVLVSRSVALLLDLVLGEESEALEEEGGEAGEEEDTLVEDEGDDGGQLELAEVGDQPLPGGVEGGGRHCWVAGGGWQEEGGRIFLGAVCCIWLAGRPWSFPPPPPPLLLAAAAAAAALGFAQATTVLHHAEADPRDQGLPADGAPEGRAVGADQEDQGRRQVQGSLLQVPLHALRLRCRQGQQAQAVPPTRFECPGGLSCLKPDHAFTSSGNVGLSSVCVQ